ncbi:hypothetical protein ACWCYZ_21460 [Streptomyces virginiae]
MAAFRERKAYRQQVLRILYEVIEGNHGGIRRMEADEEERG